MRRSPTYTAALFFALLAIPMFAVRSEPNASPRFTVTYPIGDLPVWSKGGEVEPRILVGLLRSSLGTDVWQWADDKHQILRNNNTDCQISVYAAGECLVVSAPKTDHEVISTVLSGLRAKGS